MTAEQLHPICHPAQFAAIHTLYYETPKRGGPVDRVDRSLEQMHSLVETVDLDTVGGMLLLLNAARKEENTRAIAQGLMMLVRLLKRKGFSFEDCLLMTAVSFVTSDSAGMDRAIATMMSLGIHSRAAGAEEGATPLKMNGSASHERQRRVIG